MCNVIGLEVIAYGILYFLTCRGCEAFITTYKNYGERQRTPSAIEQPTNQVSVFRLINDAIGLEVIAFGILYFLTCKVMEVF